MTVVRCLCGILVLFFLAACGILSRDHGEKRESGQIVITSERVVLLAKAEDPNLAARSFLKVANERGWNPERITDRIFKVQARAEELEPFEGDGGDFKIELSDPNVVYGSASPPPTPNDARYGDQWALHKDYINGPAAWTTAAKNPVLVAVIDSGVDETHPDLKDMLWTNPWPNSLGYINDLHGANVINGDGNIADDNGHGTWVAGVIAAEANNSVDITGLARNTQIVVCKFLASDGRGSLADAIKCLEYVRGLHDKLSQSGGPELVVTNNSWGSSCDSALLKMEIQEQQKAGILFVAAAGNKANDLDVTAYYPASYLLPNLISVAATNRNDRIWPHSNYGGHTVDVGAPGAHIRSLRRALPAPSSCAGAATPCPNPVEVNMKSGTSVAAAHVSGLIALLRAQGLPPALPAPQPPWSGLKNLVLAGGSDIAGPKGKRVVSGRRIRAADPTASGPHGSLTCKDQYVQKWLEPVLSSPSTTDRLLQFMSINCAQPAGVLSATITLPNGTVQTITLSDALDTVNEVAGDGVYSAPLTTPVSGTYTASATFHTLIGGMMTTATDSLKFTIP